MNVGYLSVIVVFCALISFLLSGMEAGIFNLNRIRIRYLSRTGDRKAQLLQWYLDKPQQFLWTILTGNILASFFVVSISAVYLKKIFEANHMLYWIVFLAVVFGFYLLCDLIPKMIFRMFPNKLCLMMALPFKYVSILLSPFVSLLNGLTALLLKLSGSQAYTTRLFGSRDEIKYLMQESSGTITSDEISMIRRVLELSTISVRQLVVPMHSVITVEPLTTVGDALKLFREKNISYLPVIRRNGNKSSVAGIISLKDILYSTETDPSKPVAHFVKPAIFITADTRLEKALERMQKSGRRLAIVIEPDKTELGIITFNDILGFVFGSLNL